VKLAVTLSGLALLVAGSASAADMPVKAPRAPAYIPAYSWTGIYLGVHGGVLAGESNSSVTSETPLSGTFGKSYDPSGGFIGAHAGFLYQFGNGFVLGLEGDVDHPWAEGDGAPQPSELLIASQAFGEAEIKWTASVRGRFGYAFDRTLLYATGGVAFAKLDHSLTMQSQLPGGYDRSADLVGWTVGAGLAQAFTNHLSGFVEYRYTDYGHDSFNNVDIGGGPTANGTINLKTHMIRAGLSFKIFRD
jgi:outer membrane immunogenic protein